MRCQPIVFCQALFDGVAPQQLQVEQQSGVLTVYGLKDPMHPYSRSKGRQAPAAHQDLLKAIVTLGTANKPVYVEGLQLGSGTVGLGLGTPEGSIGGQSWAL